MKIINGIVLGIAIIGCGNWGLIALFDDAFKNCVWFGRIMRFVSAYFLWETVRSVSRHE